MNQIGIYTLAYIFAIFAAIHFVPFHSKYILILVQSSMVILFLYLNRKSLKQFKKPNKKIFIVSSIAIISILFSIYLGYERWTIEPFGMWDAWAIWNLKAKTLTYEYLYADHLNIPHVDWAQKDYPLGLPLIHASIGISIGYWSERITYVSQIILHSAICFSFLRYFYNFSQYVLLSFLSLLFLSINVYYTTIVTDLCAELILSFCLLILYIQFINFKKIFDPSKFELMSFGSIVALPMLFKNEGILISLLFIFLFVINLLVTKSFSPQRILYFSIPIFASLILLLYWKSLNQDVIPVDFQRQSYENIFSEIKVRSEFVKIYFMNYHRTLVFLLFPITILFAFFTKKSEFFFLGLHLMILILLYNLSFILSNRDISWHLNTAYARIHAALIPCTIFLFFASFSLIQSNSHE